MCCLSSSVSSYTGLSLLVCVLSHPCVPTLRYLPDVTGDGLVSQINNPEVEVDIAKPDVRTRQLIMELRVVTNKLRHAQSGQDMDFMDSKDYYTRVRCSVCRTKPPIPCSR